ncbi:MAG TPA: hypothetical protein PLU88_11195 [Armatimonadota bacterium]|nr:hypothetical protein [Armatimonadota bacterium]
MHGCCRYSTSYRMMLATCSVLTKGLILWLAFIVFLLPVYSQDTQEITEPPQAPEAETTPTVPPPGETVSIPGQPGETPHAPSEPPTDYEPTPGPTVDITGGVTVPIDENTLQLNADFWRADFEESEAVLIVARGNVQARYRNFTVTSDQARADLRTRIAEFRDNVVLEVDGVQATGAALVINLDTREWQFDTAYSEIQPQIFPELLRAPVFLSGGSVSGEEDDIFRVVEGGFTTCNLEDPHYFVSTGIVTLWPERKLIARDATFFALGRRIFRIPRLAIPLSQLRERQNLTPRVGQTQEEGFFLKAAYSYAATLRHSGNAKLDLMTRKGIGIGLEDNYNINWGLGNLFLYYLADRNRNLNTLTGRWNHSYNIGTISANITSDYRSNSFLYAPETSTWANELRLSRNREATATNLSVRQSTDHGFGTFSILTSSLQHSQSFGQNSSANVNLEFFSSESPLTVGDQTVNGINSQLVTQLDYSRRDERFDWNLRINKINDLSNEAFISQAGTRFAGIERLPELELTTTSERLNNRTLFGVPLRLNLAVGQYRENFGRTETERLVADIDMPSRVVRLNDKLNLTTGAGFRQYLYGNNTAQFSLDGIADLSYRLGNNSSASLSYRFLRPRGFTPFSFDFIGNYNIINARLNVQESPKLRFSLFTGYDFERDQSPWQDISTRIAYTPSDRYLIYASTGYNLNQSEWRPLINQFRVRLPNDFRLDIGSRYDIERGRFASIKTQLDVPISDKWRIRANTGYNGFTHDFDYTNIQIVRDLHCWELALTYVDQQGFWDEKGIRLNLRIKAFPIFDSFGVGQFGQALDTSVGEVL